jgi:branched-chain amino acid transport system ATP-binding protein
MSQADAILAVEGITRRFGGLVALSEVSFSIRKGEIYGLIGPNGAGKTTLFNVLTGLYRQDEGRFHFEGRELKDVTPDFIARLGIARTFQNIRLFGNMTALENVMVGRHRHLDRRFLPSLLRLPGIARGDAACCERAAELMRFVGLGDAVAADAASLPYGALRRLEIARAIASEPRLLLLDEPAAGLNPAETEGMSALIRRIAESGVTVLLVEHDMRLVMGVSQRVTVLDRGRRIADGTPAEIASDPAVVAAYLGTEDAA